ncbi:MAG: hypothetical protein ACE5EO_01180 [Candidatus Krumholzibacteriia bacterium]
MSRKTTVLVIASLFLLSALAGPAAAQFGRNKIQYKNHNWHVLSTPHFEIHFYDGSDAFAVRAGLVLEDGYRMLSGKLHETLPWKVPVILYGSHNDFLQTNVSLESLSEGVQAFAEPSRKRIVLPFTGSYPQFAHTAIHELAHVFTFQIIYSRLLDNVFSRTSLFGLPLWVMEGVAEYLAVGWDPETDMYVRDGVIHNYLGDLSRAGGFAVYKQGQSAWNYIDQTYGKEKVLEILDALAITRNADAALEKTIGLSTTELTRKWQKAQRKHYWPLYADKHEAPEIGRRLTNHVKERAAYNTKPVLSPDGETIAFFSSRELISIYLMSAVDGKIIKKLVTGHKSNQFESLHFFTSSMSFKPDGKELTFVAKSDGRSQLFIVDTKKGKVRKKLDLGADGLASPTWSPKGDVIVVSAVFGGQTDLMLVDCESGEYRRLTNDFADQLNPRFFPDGKRIAFEYYPQVTAPVPADLSAEGRRTLSEMDFLATDNVKHGGTLDIYEMDLGTASSRPLIETSGDDSSPMVFDEGRRMVFTSDASGIRNLYVADLETGEYHRFTDVLGGVFTPDVVDSKNRIAFSAFSKNGWDIYVSDELEALLNKNYGSDISPALATRRSEQTALLREGPRGPDIPAGTLLRRAEAEEHERPAVRVRSVDESEDDVFSVADEDSLEKLGITLRIPDATIIDESKAKLLSDAKEGSPAGAQLEGVQRPIAGDEPATRGGSVSGYKLKLAPDFIGQGGGLYYSTGFGFGLANTIALSDMLGNHRMVFSFNLFRTIEDSDLLAQYFYLKHRINYGAGIFQFKNFLNSRVTSIGESFQDYQLFSERNYGVFGLASYPFNTFDRLDFELQAFVSDREFFDEVRTEEDLLTFEETGKSTRNLIEPSLSFVHDASFYGPYGPIDGSRYYISASKGFGIGNNAVSRGTVFIDYRKYFKLWYRNSLAFRATFAGSEGDDPRSFFLGGPSTLRGFDYLEFEGSRLGLASIEYRFPLIDELIIGFPGRWGFGNIGGSAFFDVGAAWDGSDIRVFKKDVNGLQFEDLRGDFGFGTHFYFGFFLLNFQLAWQTDLRSVGASQFHFFLGPSF